MAKLRLGVIGAGSWTVSSHLPNLLRHRDEVEFVIVNRRNPELLGKIQKNFGFAKASTDWRDVIAEKPDIVVVGSPPGYHWEQSKAALEAGAHVMCEKPFTIDPDHAWDLDETAKRTGRSLILSYGWNYRPMVIQAHRMLHEDGGIGDIARDRWISAQVRTRILSDSAIRDINYTIDTQNKTVYVLGIAQSQSELDRVLAHARAVAEVRRVVNYALLKDDPRRFKEPPGTYEDDNGDATAPPETD